MKISCSVFVVFVVIGAVTSSHYYDYDPEAEREKITKQTEICVRMHYPGRDWNKVIAAGGLSSGTRYCIAKNTGLMDDDNKLVKHKLELFVSDEPEGYRDGKTTAQVRDQIWKACENVYNRYYSTKSAGMILDCLGEEMKKVRKEPYTVI